eukprot:m.784396 g.784396  ORF g.784396 m.784396 type:complete len:50 (+) comp23298_c3_seq5:1551-1700(+)
MVPFCLVSHSYVTSDDVSLDGPAWLFWSHFRALSHRSDDMPTETRERSS